LHTKSGVVFWPFPEVFGRGQDTTPDFICAGAERVINEINSQVQPAFPPTVIVRHPRENPRKCSVIPLKGRPDVLFLSYPVRQPPPLENYVRLAIDGPELSAADASHGILLLDGSWRWSNPMNRDFAHVQPRSLSRIITAYPRKSKLGQDPEEGLASIEALYAAYQILGRPTQGLLDQYRWAEEFLQLNRERFASNGPEV
jgi:pre-rRNA-processing protein TSR3